MGLCEAAVVMCLGGRLVVMCLCRGPPVLSWPVSRLPEDLCACAEAAWWDWYASEEFSCASEDASDRGPTWLIGPNKVIELS